MHFIKNHHYFCRQGRKKYEGFSRNIPSLVRAMIQKDVCARYSVRYPETLWQMANLLLDNVAQEMPLRQITRRMDIASPHTVKKYVDYLTNAYLICPIQKFSYKSIIRQSANKIYAIDPAFVNMRGNTEKEIIQGGSWKTQFT